MSERWNCSRSLTTRPLGTEVEMLPMPMVRRCHVVVVLHLLTWTLVALVRSWQLPPELLQE